MNSIQCLQLATTLHCYRQARGEYLMHFSSKEPQGRFTFGPFLSGEVTWSNKNQVLMVVIDPWPGGKSGGLCSRRIQMTTKYCAKAVKCQYLFFLFENHYLQMTGRKVSSYLKITQKGIKRF